MLTILGKPVAGSIVASLLLLTVSISALSSTQSTILPTARGTLSMAVYEAIPKRFANVHPRYMTPAFGTIVMGVSASVSTCCWRSYPRTRWRIRSRRWAWQSRSITASPHSAAPGTSAARCSPFPFGISSSAGCFRYSAALVMAWAFIKSAIDMINPDYGYTTFGSIGGVFVIESGCWSWAFHSCCCASRSERSGSTAETPQRHHRNQSAGRLLRNRKRGYRKCI